ncbi:hypothetical protein FQA39_LY19037 [Lamprigera yunnana]|nr:hypothetical protein FQA39_LY19037 [Lamprigera yunnana]
MQDKNTPAAVNESCVAKPPAAGQVRSEPGVAGLRNDRPEPQGTPPDRDRPGRHQRRFARAHRRPARAGAGQRRTRPQARQAQKPHEPAQLQGSRARRPDSVPHARAGPAGGARRHRAGQALPWHPRGQRGWRHPLPNADCQAAKRQPGGGNAGPSARSAALHANPVDKSASSWWTSRAAAGPGLFGRPGRSQPAHQPAQANHDVQAHFARASAVGHAVGCTTKRARALKKLTLSSRRKARQHQASAVLGRQHPAQAQAARPLAARHHHQPGHSCLQHQIGPVAFFSDAVLLAAPSTTHINTMTKLHLHPGPHPGPTAPDLQQPVQLSLDASADAAINASVACVESIIAEGRTAYGINTGFGLLASTRIAPEDLAQLQRSLVLAHAAGRGRGAGRCHGAAHHGAQVNAWRGGFSGHSPPSD